MFVRFILEKPILSENNPAKKLIKKMIKSFPTFADSNNNQNGFFYNQARFAKGEY